MGDELQSAARQELAAASAKVAPLVVKPRLQKIDAVVAHQINQPVFGSDAARPDIRTHLLEMLGLAYPGKRISHDGVDQVENTKRCLSVGINAPAQVLQAFGLYDRGSSVALSALPIT